ncbi:MAG: dockerin type I repeat-containing protein [Oscillospiraceae bacterium]|nr:dockerin type I repeat-containing protein [Oscillospiraceae bacterium]
MKKLLRIGSALLALMLLLSVTVLAADPPKEAGIYDLVLESDYADIPVKVLLATQDGATDSGIAAEEAEIDGGAVQFYPGGVKVWFELDVPEGFNLVLGLNEDDVPTEQNIEYIDQQTTVDGKVAFTVYPKSESGTVIVKLANAEGVKKVLSFKLYQAYKLGDVDEDGSIGTLDALYTLQYYAGIIDLTPKQKLAADVDQNGDIGTLDALLILQAYAGIVSLG